MSKNPVQKCRTCLRNSANTFSLKQLVTGCSPEKTYGQLLEECAKLENSDVYEHLMPQYLCPLCCRELKNAYAFIKQAQTCNNKLVHVISKKLECLQEKIIDVPKNRSILIKESLDDTNQQKHTNVKTSEVSQETSSEQLVTTETNNAINNAENAEEIILCNERTESVDLSLETATNSDECEINTTEESLVVITCPICEKNMITHDDLKLHMHSHHDIDSRNKLIHQQALEVKKVFDCKQRLEARKTFDCKLCPSKYSNRYSYIYHLKHKHNIDKIQRKEGNAKKETLKKAKVIKCRSCDYTARTYAALNYHTRAKHGTENDKFKCKFCNYLCIKKFDLLTHVRNVHKELIKTLKAEAINRGEIREASSAVEVKKSEEEFSSDDDIPLARTSSSPKVKTKEDEEQFSDEEFIRSILNIKRRHNKASTTSLARRCNECGNVYKNYTALYAHQKTVHISKDKYSLCPHCGKEYKRKTDLRIHVERKHIPKNSNEIAKQPSKVVREKRFMCTQCSYVCTTITLLNIHINRKHTGEKPYKCDVCFKSFLIPYDLKIHRYLHTGERPYKCPICAKGFRDNSHMRKHKRIHSSERPFKCKECGKGFALAYYLSVHNRTHLKERKLNCITCGKVFQNRSLLNFHRINEDHQDEVA